MRDGWLQRALSVLAGGGFALFLPEDFRPWVLAVLLLLGVRFWFWRPRDFFGQLKRPELLLLGAIFIAGYLYGMAAERILPEPLTLETVEVTGVLKDWSRLSDKASGTITLEAIHGVQGESRTGVSDNQGNQENPASIVLTSNWEVPGTNGFNEGERFRLVVYPDKEGKLPGLWEKVLPGDALSFKARLERPKPVGTKGGFDPQIFNAARGLEGVLIARGEPLALHPGNPPLAWRVREQVNLALEPFETGVTKEGTGVAGETGVLKGILFGDASGIPPDVMERYRITGVLHVFAASGSNVAFVIGLAWGLLRFLPQSVRIGGSSLAVVFYALLCGGSLPIVRASIMGIAVLLGQFGRGRAATLRWLFLAVLGMFVVNPIVLKDVGFQLSVAAAWGIVAVAPRLVQQTWLKKVPGSLRGLLVATLAAQITTFPILVSTFHRVSLIGFVANLFVLFLLGSVLEVGLLGVIFSFSLVLSAPFFQVSLWLLQGADQILGWLARLSWADFWVLQPGFVFWVLWYGAIMVWLFGREKADFIARVFLRRGVWKLKKLKNALGIVPKSGKDSTLTRVLNARYVHKVQTSQIPQMSHTAETGLQGLTARRSRFLPLALVFFLVLLLWSPWAGGDLQVSFLDVGQGDSLLIQTPKGRVVLIDTGPKSDRFDAGERIVLPYLLEHRIRNLNALIVTHEHADHIGGARAILDNMPVDWVGVPDSGERLQNPEWRGGIPERIWRDPERLRLLGAGDRIELDAEAWLEVVGPREILQGTHSDPNNNSMVLMLHYLDQTVFLTADMEEEEMRTLWSTEAEMVNFYKVPHHGSRFSLDKDLLDRMHPKAVFISVGRNTFGHPAPEVLRYWAEQGIPVYRTDEGGTITLHLGQQGSAIETGRRLH
ncbi:MAG: ComEC/Rec2 family competence protein [Desulfitobacteriaceae bacterium]|nr:ComEC/Rec2 family competence protein [Desulfitobacteriaceae bacterium]MDI6880884.1 ComEC/Rec2 family competence protein [Desulfitobacteriaceae bacterium]MDI6915979.1 ComEC/Rec2 family competence protein [Desulfitobacteriaceae bacterium]